MAMLFQAVIPHDWCHESLLQQPGGVRRRVRRQAVAARAAAGWGALLHGPLPRVAAPSGMRLRLADTSPHAARQDRWAAPQPAHGR